MNYKALFITIALMISGILICAEIVKTEYGEILLNLLNLVSFILGIVHMIMGGKEENIKRILGGFITLLASIGSLGLPEPIDSGIALFLGIGGFFIKLF